MKTIGHSSDIDDPLVFSEIVLQAQVAVQIITRAPSWAGSVPVFSIFFRLRA
jgi:hypothetical protein